MRLLPVPGVFQPISDSRMLADCMLREGVRGRSVLDLCTGSGMLAVTAALNGASGVTAVDISRRSILSAWLNAALNGVRVRTLRGNLFEPLRGERFDVIVSNPPYVPAREPELPARGRARAWDAGPAGRVFLDSICASVAGHLNPGGVLLMVQNTLVGERETLGSLSRCGLSADIAYRHRGALGPRLRERAEWLRERGLLDGELDEVLIVRAQASAELPVHAAHEVGERDLLG